MGSIQFLRGRTCKLKSGNHKGKYHIWLYNISKLLSLEKLLKYNFMKTTNSYLKYDRGCILSSNCDKHIEINNKNSKML